MNDSIQTQTMEKDCRYHESNLNMNNFESPIFNPDLNLAAEKSNFMFVGGSLSK